MKPYGGEIASGMVDQAKPHDELLERILDRDNMIRAWKRVKANTEAQPESQPKGLE